jgi:hypothetical protein
VDADAVADLYDSMSKSLLVFFARRTCDGEREDRAHGDHGLDGLQSSLRESIIGSTEAANEVDGVRGPAVKAAGEGAGRPRDGAQGPKRSSARGGVSARGPVRAT